MCAPANSSVTANYTTQFQLTFAQSGIGGDSTGSVVTINGSVTKTAAQLPFSAFFDSGATVTYTYADPVVSMVAGQRYTRTTPAPSPASPITVSGAATIAGTYKVQFQLTFAQSGIGADSTGTAVTVAGNPKTAGDLPFSAFYDPGVTVTYTYPDPVASTVAGQRYALTTPATSPASPITVSGAATITGTYKVQVQLTFAQTGIGGDSTGTVVTINGSVTKTAAVLPFSDWFDSGASVTYTYSSPVPTTVAGKRYALTTPAPSPGSPISVSGAATITGSYKVQFLLTITTNPPVVARTNVTPPDGWFDTGSVISLSAASPVAGGP